MKGAGGGGPGGMHDSTPPSVDSPRGGKRTVGKQPLSARRKKQPKPGTPQVGGMQHVQVRDFKILYFYIITSRKCTKISYKFKFLTISRELQ